MWIRIERGGVYLQGRGVAPSQNTAGVIVSNGVAWAIGKT